MNNTPKTVESLINEAETKWASQGRTDEQKWAVRNFITGSMQEAITALNELIAEAGTDSPDALIVYNNSLFYPSRDGFKTTGTKPQLQNVLSTDRVKIEENTCPICGASPMTANCNGANCDE